jgi:outer membrane protein assembly factor BamD (BamD/ComL family)
MASSKASPGIEYDPTHIEDARERLEEFITKNPDLEISGTAATKLSELNEQEAKKNFDVASFYERRGKIQSALLYYRLVVEQHPDTLFAQKAQDKIRALTETSQ